MMRENSSNYCHSKIWLLTQQKILFWCRLRLILRQTAPCLRLSVVCFCCFQITLNNLWVFMPLSEKWFVKYLKENMHSLPVTVFKKVLGLRVIRPAFSLRGAAVNRDLLPWYLNTGTLKQSPSLFLPLSAQSGWFCGKIRPFLLLQ